MASDSEKFREAMNDSKRSIASMLEKQKELEKGMTAEQCARKIVNGAEIKKKELLIGGKETLAVYIKRFFPGILAKIIRKVKA